MPPKSDGIAVAEGIAPGEVGLQHGRAGVEQLADGELRGPVAADREHDVLAPVSVEIRHDAALDAVPDRERDAAHRRPLEDRRGRAGRVGHLDEVDRPRAEPGHVLAAEGVHAAPAAVAAVPAVRAVGVGRGIAGDGANPRREPEGVGGLAAARGELRHDPGEHLGGGEPEPQPRADRELEGRALWLAARRVGDADDVGRHRVRVGIRRARPGDVHAARGVDPRVGAGALHRDREGVGRLPAERDERHRLVRGDRARLGPVELQPGADEDLGLRGGAVEVADEDRVHDVADRARDVHALRGDGRARRGGAAREDVVAAAAGRLERDAAARDDPGERRRDGDPLPDAHRGDRLRAERVRHLDDVLRRAGGAGGVDAGRVEARVRPGELPALREREEVRGDAARAGELERLARRRALEGRHDPERVDRRLRRDLDVALAARERGDGEEHGHTTAHRSLPGGADGTRPAGDETSGRRRARERRHARRRRTRRLTTSGCRGSWSCSSASSWSTS